MRAIVVLLILAVALFWVFWASWQLALVSLLILPPCVGLIVWIGRRMRRRSETMQERMADLQGVLHETIANVRVVKAFHAEEFETARFGRENDRFYRAFLRLRRLGVASGPLAELAMVVIAAGVLSSVLFVAIGLRDQLQMFADGSIFSYSVAVQDA